MASQEGWFEHLTGAYATLNLVGRTSLVQEIEAIIRHPTPEPQVVVLMGEGGSGKTRLLLDIRQRAASLGVQAPDALIDLYHIQTHTPEGLTTILTRAFPPGTFPHFERERHRLETLRLAGSSETHTQSQKLLNTFIEELNNLATERKVLLTLDTAERLLYGSQQMPDSVTDVPHTWRWLVENLPRLQNCVILLAGRPQTDRLYQELKAALPHHVHPKTVGPFTIEESLAYFEAVAHRAEATGDKATASRVAELTPQERQLAHFFADGRPILLALVIDHLMTAAPQEKLFDASHGTIVTQEELQRFEQALLRRFRQTAREIGDTIIALGRVPKGADADLLARIMGLSQDEAQILLNKVKQLSFVKQRPADQRIFLHDEIYALLKRLVYADPDDAIAARLVAAEIQEYYAAHLQRVRGKLDTLFTPIEQGATAPLVVAQLTELNEQRRVSLTEDVFYRLRNNAEKGFRQYYRYMREAILSGDPALDVWLHLELLAFLDEADPDGNKEVIDGLERNVVQGVLALRGSARLWAQGRYQEALTEIRRLREQGRSILTKDGSVSEASRTVWEAYISIYLGGSERLRTARQLVNEVIEKMKAVLAEDAAAAIPHSENWQWRTTAILAFAYRVRGFLKRNLGDMHGATQDYRQAAALWRTNNIVIELATSLNDLGFAMMEQGQWDDARAVATEALELRRSLGPRTLVGLSLNTLANIELREGQYQPAIAGAERALTLFRLLENESMVGLALNTLAEAKRRLSNELPSSQWQQKIDLLQAALHHARESLGIFLANGSQNRQIESQIEIGSTLRYLVRVLRERNILHYNTPRLIQEGVQALTTAADLAGEELIYRRVDALVNLAWLGYVANDLHTMDDAIHRAEVVVPTEYWLNPATGRPDIEKDEAQALLWPQLGKLYALYGHRDFTSQPSPVLLGQPMLHNLTRHYVLSIAYNTLFGKDYRDLRRVKADIYANLKRLSAEQLREVAQATQKVEEEFNLGESAFRQLLVRRALWFD